MDLNIENNSHISNTDQSGFPVNMEFFSGPMDLLLHLVQQQEVAIEKVSMKLIAQQYLDIVFNSKIIDIDKASEYLVIAATLLAIKSASLLPSNNLVEDAPVEELHDERFYSELREKLRIYQLTKQRAQALMQLPQLGVDVFSRADRQALQPTGEMLAEEEEAVDTLAMNFARLLKKIGGLAKTYAIRLEEVSVVSYMMKIIDSLFEQQKNNAKSFTFSSVMQGLLGLKLRKFSFANINPNKQSLKNKGVIIGSFAAVLELMKRGVLRASQLSEYEDIRLDICISQEQVKEVDLLTSEFDTPAEVENDKVLHMKDYRESTKEIVLPEEEKILKEANRG